MTVQSIDTLGERIRYAREAAKLSQSDIARYFRISRVSVTQWESNTTKPDMNRISGLASLLNTTVEWLIERKGFPPLVSPDARPLPAPIIPGKDLVGAKDMPVYAAAMGGGGHIIITFDPIDYVKRPAVLQNVSGGYGILVKGESMVPAYREGDTALVNPHQPPARDTDVVLYHTPPKERGEAQAIIKRLTGFNDRYWRLEQYNPFREFHESRADWLVCHRVVGKYNAR
jgi:phage repressor protein C with HTH and peptisase S24 domain